MASETDRDLGIEEELEPDGGDREGLTEFEDTVDVRTPEADYHFHGGIHISTTELEESVIDGIDGIILESGFTRYSDWDLDALAHQTQYTELIGENLSQEDPAPMYLTDISPGKRDSLVDTMAKTGLPGVVGLLNMPAQEPAALLALPFLSEMAKMAIGTFNHSTDSGGGFVDEALGYLGLPVLPNLVHTGAQ